MSHSVVKVIEADIAESLTLIVGEDGIITPDKETALSILGNRPTTDLNILYMNKSAGNKLDVTLDSLMFINSDEVEDADYNMDEVSRNLRNLQLDHDYTILKSPARPPVEEEIDLEDELAQTLRLLDGNLPDDEVEQKISQINKQKEKAIVEAAKKAETPATPAKALKVVKAIVPTQKVVQITKRPSDIVEKTPVPKNNVEAAEDMEVGDEEDEEDSSSSDAEEESSDDDDDDSDFTLDNEKQSTKTLKPRLTTTRRSTICTDKPPPPPPPKPPARLSKLKPTTAPKTPKLPGGKQLPNSSTPSANTEKRAATPTTPVAIAKPVVAEQQEAADVEGPAVESKPQLESISRVVDKKALPPKKEKKAPKPIPDDFALFSTPDIIRRVGSGKDSITPTTDTPTKQPPSPQTPTPSPQQQPSPKPNKISPESRSRTTSTDTKTITPQTPSKLPSQKRHSSDSKQSRDTSALTGPITTLNTTPNRRPSVDKPSCVVVKQLIGLGDVTNVSVQEFEATNSSSESLGAEVSGVGLDVVPSAEDIRAIIQSDATKTFTTYQGSGLSAEPLNPNNPATTIPISTTNTTPQVTVSSLDHIDQTLLLDNISPDLITEDILYQVAQSLVDNTLLQNAIDKMEVDPAVSGFIGDNQGSCGSMDSNNMHMTNTPTIMTQVPQPQQYMAPVQQIVRPDGRVITLPPVERPTTRSRNRKGPATLAESPAVIVAVSTPPTPAPSLLNTSVLNSPATSVLSTPTSGVRIIKTPVKPLDDDHVSGNELDSSNDDDDGDEEDPNKLWCICNQPHNNRFMICCDTCEEWYHGKCVNVTKAMGQAMESEGKEWMCLYCKNASLKRPKAAARRIRKASRTSSESASKSSTSTVTTPTSVNRIVSANQLQHSGKQPTKQKQATSRCLICAKPTTNNKLFCSDECIVKHAENVEKKIVVYDRHTHKVLTGANAPTAANLDRWLKDHPTYEVIKTTKDTPMGPGQQKKTFKQALAAGPLTQSKLKLVRNDGSPAGGVSLAVQKKGVNIGVLKHGPAGPGMVAGVRPGMPKIMKKQLPPGVKIIPRHQPAPTILNNAMQQSTPKTVKLIPAASLPQHMTLTQQNSKQNTITKAKATIQTKLNMSSSSTPPSSAERKKSFSVNSFIRDKAPGSAKEKKQAMPARMPIVRQTEMISPGLSAAQKEESIREGARSSLLEQLQNRLKLVDDLKLTEEQLSNISDEIESQLYKCFGDTSQKYKNKYRSLIFNIKDLKNQTLWRKICEKAINPYQLVRLSSDDLASQELALWRERETKHQLDMIKKSELELMSCNRQYVFKTHKGEQVFEDEKPKENITEVISDLGGADSTLDRDKDGEKSTKDRDKKSSSSKSSKRDRDRSKDRGRDRDRKSSKDKTDSKDRKRDNSKDRSRKKRSRSRDRSDRDRKRSRSRDRRRDKDRRSSHKSSRHKKDLDNKLDKKSTELLEQLVDKHILKPFEDKLWKHVPQDDLLPNASLESDSDHEPTSTVTIPTPPRTTDPEETPSADKSSTTTVTLTPAVVTNDSDDKFDIPATPSPTTSPKTVAPTIAKVISSASSNASSSPGTSEPLWRGTINMVDVAEISITAHEVSGDCHGLSVELPPALDIVGRISPDTVWDYIGNMKSSNSKVISLLRLNATNVEEKMPYIALYSYLSSRNRLGVVKVMNKVVKDFYILPLASHRPIPQALLPLNGPGFEEARPHLLLGIVIRHKRKRPAIESTSSLPNIKRVKVDVVITGSPKDRAATAEKESAAAAVHKEAASRSYTPPPSTPPVRERLDPRKARILSPTVNVVEKVESVVEIDAGGKGKKVDEVVEAEDDGSEERVVEEAMEVVEEAKKAGEGGEVEDAGDEDEPYSPEDSDPDSNIVPADSSRLNANDISSLLTGSVKTSSFIESGLSTSQAFEPFTSKFDSIPGLDDGTPIPASTLELQRKMAELDQRIAMQKAEIDNMSHDIATTATTDIGTSVLANIALPSDLQQILENIKTIGGNAQKDSGAKTPDAKNSPIVHNPRWSPPDTINSTGPPAAASSELTMPLILPRLNTRTGNPIQSFSPQSSIPLNLPAAVLKVSNLSKLPQMSPPSYESTTSVLSSLTEEDLIRKAAEMLGEIQKPVGGRNAPNKSKKIKMDLSGVNINVPPPPLPVPAPMIYASLPITSGYKSMPVLLPPLPTKKPHIPVEMAQPPIPGLEDDIL